MSILKRLVTAKALKHSLQIFAGIAAVYVLISPLLIYRPSPTPFADSAVTRDQRQPNVQAPVSSAAAVGSSSYWPMMNDAIEFPFLLNVGAEVFFVVVLLGYAWSQTRQQFMSL